MTRTHLPRRLAIAAALVAGLAIGVMPVLAADHAVSIAGREFKPAQVNVAVGDRVVWTVTEAIGEPHSVTHGEPDFSGQGGVVFDSGVNLRDNGQTFEFTFGQAGVYPYFCQVHPDMRGQVVVLEPGQTPPAVEAPPSEVETGVAPERRLLAAGILTISIVLMFGLAWVWRRLNPA